MISLNMHIHCCAAHEYLNNVDDGADENQQAILLKDIEETVLADVGDKNMDMQRAIDFKHNNTYIFSDFWQVDCMDYTPRFIWCCHAIQWAISQYDS